MTALSDERMTASASSIRSLDAGAWFGPQYRGERSPTLDDVLRTLGVSVEYEIEVKARSTETARAILALVRTEPADRAMRVHQLVALHALVHASARTECSAGIVREAVP